MGLLLNKIWEEWRKGKKRRKEALSSLSSILLFSLTICQHNFTKLLAFMHVIEGLLHVHQ